MKKMFAFTLAEVLITLSILGVVAAITVPSIINKNSERETVTKVKKIYSALTQAYDVAMAEQGTDPATWYTDTGKYVQEIIMSYMNVDKTCTGADTSCASTDTYKTLNEKANWAVNNLNWSGYPKKYQLHDGMSITFSINTTTCTASHGTGNLSKYCGDITVDINGKKKPNKLGYDTFQFLVTKNGIEPVGTKYEEADTIDEKCNMSSTDNNNGLPCTAWVVYKGNMDYLRKDVSW